MVTYNLKFKKITTFRESHYIGLLLDAVTWMHQFSKSLVATPKSLRSRRVTGTKLNSADLQTHKTSCYYDLTHVICAACYSTEGDITTHCSTETGRQAGRQDTLNLRMQQINAELNILDRSPPFVKTANMIIINNDFILPPLRFQIFSDPVFGNL
jgi:ribosomal protein L32